MKPSFLPKRTHRERTSLVDYIRWTTSISKKEMVSRKSHLKSRNGCQNCKKRRIKCDERSPSCGNCTKHSIVCNFARKGPTADLQRRHQSNHDDENLTLNTENFSLQERTISSKQIAPSLPVEELELFYHFITATCFTLSDRPKSHELWQKVVPKHAFAHTPLLRGILATSALHLSQSSLRGEITIC